jgi:hypothetical protein
MKVRPEATKMSRGYVPGIVPDENVYANHIPAVVRGEGHIPCLCTWGDSGDGRLMLRFRNLACIAKALGGHK